MTRSATIVGSGPNGLAAALELARAGIRVTVLEAESEIGGGTRSHRPFTTVDLLVDHCAGFHPMAVGSPALAGLEQYGLTWRWPEIDCAHPLLDDPAALLHRSVQQTAAGLGADGKRWKALFGHPSSTYDRLSADLLGPVVHVPRTHCCWQDSVRRLRCPLHCCHGCSPLRRRAHCSSEPRHTRCGR